MRNFDSCHCWRCTLCPCKVRNKYVNFWNRTIFCVYPIYVQQINISYPVQLSQKSYSFDTIKQKIILCYVIITRRHFTDSDHLLCWKHMVPASRVTCMTEFKVKHKLEPRSNIRTYEPHAWLKTFRRYQTKHPPGNTTLDNESHTRADITVNEHLLT